MKVKFHETTEIYNLRIFIPSFGLVQIFPPYPEDKIKNGFLLLTDKESVYGKYSEYTTIYRKCKDGSIILSNDGRVWSPKPEPEPLTLEELRAIKKAEISELCEQTIYSGISVNLENGLEHFSLTEKDQINLFGKQAQLASGIDKMEYHQDGHPCRYYSAEEMKTIIQAAMEHVSYHTTYCNSLNMWIAKCTTKEELDDISYGIEIPVEYQSKVLKDYLAKMKAE